MPVVANIAQIAEEHAQLELSIANYDHAPADLRETTGLLESVENDLKIREARMEKLIEKRKAEHKDLDKLQRSGTKRFLVRMKHGGKEGLERRLEKEEREYIEAAQNEHNENRAISELKAAAENARLKKADLESEVVIRKEMLRRLDELYESAFDGPSPDFPEEDSAENELREAEVHFEHVQSRLSHEKNVFSILEQVASCANQAHSALQSANVAATYDTFSIGGIWAQMAEADDLIRAQTLAAQAQRLLDRARGLQPLVKAIPPGRIVSPEWLNVVFDNMYTDFMFQQKIKQSIESVRKYQEGIFAECAASEERVKSLTRDANDAREFLKSRRRQLVATRREILARIREEGGVRVFTRPDADSARDGDESVPQLPTYAQQPEEGAKVLARGEPQGMVSMPIPAPEEQPTPPRYNSQPTVPPSFPKAEIFPNPPPPESRSPEHAASGTINTFPPPLGAPPRSQPLSSFSVLSLGPRLPEAAPGLSADHHPSEALAIQSEDNTHSAGLTNASDEAPTHDGHRNESRPSFASNNPYRTVCDPSG